MPSGSADPAAGHPDRPGHPVLRTVVRTVSTLAACAGWVVALLIQLSLLDRHRPMVITDVHYYYRVLTGVWGGDLGEYPVVGLWPVHLLIALTRSAGGDEAWFTVAFSVMCAVCSAFFTLWLLWRDPSPWCPAAWFWVLYSGCAGPIILTRLDLFPGLLVAAAAALLFARHRSGRTGGSGGSGSVAQTVAAVLLAVATAAKLWPGVLAAGLVGRWRHLSTWARTAGFLAALAVVAGLVAAVSGADRLTSPLDYQTDRGLQVESVSATPLVLAAALGHQDGRWHVGQAPSKSIEITGPWESTMVTVADVGLIVVLVAAAGVGLWRLLRGGWTPQRTLSFWAALIMAVIVTDKVLSPQYLVWITPLLAVGLTVSRRPSLRIAALLTVVAALLTTLVFPVNYDGLLADGGPELLPAVLLTVRNGLLLLVTAVCLRWATARDR
ncbi:MAG: glycosyltransferase 87 family protein [Corynebacterium nuruki]|nr:glycosyltransferase 87 family protein [Corynebacterium nuruki]